LAILHGFLCTDAGPRILEIIDHVTDKGNKAYTLAKELVVED
jgi:hypothetical protein